MGKLIISIIFVAVIITEIIQGLLAAWISLRPEKSENLSFSLEEPMDTCNNFTSDYMKIDNTTLDILGHNFVKIYLLQGIYLENNEIVYISPNAFDDVPNLTCLNIGWNYATTLFQDFLPFFKHTSLKKLNLAQAVCKHSLDACKYQNSPIPIEEIVVQPQGFLPNVTHLDISGNGLSDLPMYFKSLFPNLTHLYLSDNRFNSSLVDRIPETTQYLYLERNGGEIDLTHLPRNISALFLSENFIINTYVFKEFRKLTTLSLRMYEWPFVIRTLKHLESGKISGLDISSNSIQDIKDIVFRDFKFLKHLNLNNNLLSSLYFLNGLKSLEHLSVANNKISCLSRKYFINSLRLKTLDLRGNRIYEMESDALSQLTLLHKIDLSENLLAELPDKWWQHLNNLEYLNLESNRFRSIEKMSVTSNSNLKHLYVGNNNFTAIVISNTSDFPSSLRIHVFKEN